MVKKVRTALTIKEEDNIKSWGKIKSPLSENYGKQWIIKVQTMLKSIEKLYPVGISQRRPFLWLVSILALI